MAKLNLVETLLKMDKGLLELPTKIHTMHCSKMNVELPFTLKAISTERYAQIQKTCMTQKNNGVQVDLYKLQTQTLLEGCEELSNDKLLKHFDAHTPKDLLEKLFVYGELNELTTEINKLNKIVTDDKSEYEEIKN